MTTDTPKTVYLKDYTPPPFLIEDVDLRFELDEDTTLVRSTLTLSRNPEFAAPRDDLTLVVQPVAVAADGGIFISPRCGHEGVE